MVETNVHYPTDINLLFDAIRKAITESAQLCQAQGLTEWRQCCYNIKSFKRKDRLVQTLKHSTSKDEKKRQAHVDAMKKAHQEYLDQAASTLVRIRETRQRFCALPNFLLASLKDLDSYLGHADRQIDQIRRRVIKGEVIPHQEKVFSLFEPHTEWISKGKAGVPVELGVRVCILEDRNRFILYHQVMEQKTDDQVAVSMVKGAKERFPRFILCSFDKGFHSPANQEALKAELATTVLPKKGRWSAADRERESAPEFVAARKAHSGVESAINGLEVHGLDLCRDHGIDGFKRYVALAIVARNIQRLGVVVRKLAANKRGSYQKRPPAQQAI